jgi:hypothetical protein
MASEVSLHDLLQVFVDSITVARKREALHHAGYDLLIEPWHSVRERNARRWGKAGGDVRVRRQVGVVCQSIPKDDYYDDYQPSSESGSQSDGQAYGVPL